MKYIIDNWYLIISSMALIALIGMSIYNFLDKPTDEQIKQVKEWLLYAVTEAEKELGSKTGKLKLRYVFDMFVQRFPQVSRFVTFEQFSAWVDEALIVMRTMIRTNNAVKELVEGE